jgi:hypothetical protein
MQGSEETVLHRRPVASSTSTIPVTVSADQLERQRKDEQLLKEHRRAKKREQLNPGKEPMAVVILTLVSWRAVREIFTALVLFAMGVGLLFFGIRLWVRWRCWLSFGSRMTGVW